MAMRVACSLATLLGLISPAWAENCRLALVLALDVSGSVDAHEDRLQREGVAHALLAPEVAAAFLNGDPVAIYAFEWSGRRSQAALLRGWRLIESEQDLSRVATEIILTQRARFHDTEAGTALGAALAHAAMVFEEGPDCRTQTVDISGDGHNNIGPEPAAVYATHSLDQVTVNALVVTGPEANIPLVQWFEAKVLHGPGAFWVEANGYEDFAQAMQAKLLRELEITLASRSPLVGHGGM